MPERDGYIPGVPCWIDTSQPDPEAAVAFYGGLFGWEFEDVMPPGSPGSTSSPGSAAAMSPPSRRPEAAPPRDVEHLHLGRQRRRGRLEGRRRRRHVADGAVRRDGRRPDGGLRRPGGRRLLRLAGEAAQRRTDRQRATARLNFNGLNTRDPGTREGVLRLGLRMADAGARRRRRDVDAARLRRLISSATSPGLRERIAEMGVTGGFEDVVASLIPIRTTSRTSRRTGASRSRSTTRTRRPRRPTELGGTVLVPPFDAPWVRMTVIADPAGRDVHREQVRPREP